MLPITEDRIMEKLKSIKDPELNLGIVDLGLIYKVDINDKGDIGIDMTLTSPGCPYGEAFMAKVKDELKKLDGIGEVKVNLVFDPPWDPEKMATDYVKDELGIW